MPNFAVAMRVEAENCKQTIYQDIFQAANKYEAMGKALETFIRGGSIQEVNVKKIDITPEGDYKYDLDYEIAELCRAGKKINAIKLRREKTGEGLKEAQDYVEELMVKQNIRY
jgi:ribosomal protein L7/L12